MSKTRIPIPMSELELRAFRWTTPLAVPLVKRVSQPNTRDGDNDADDCAPRPIKIYVGETSHSHLFAQGSPAIAQKVWGYGLSKSKITYPGPTLEAIAGESAHIQWVNVLKGSNPSRPEETARHPFAHTPRELFNGMSMGRYSVGHTVAHMHGAHVPWVSDGFSMRVSSGMDNPMNTKTVLRPGQASVNHYPNVQAGGAMLWYHDHAMDMTSKNVYAGLAGVYLLRHKNENTEMKKLFRPSYLRANAAFTYEIPLVLQDRSFTDGRHLLYGDAAFLTQYLDRTPMSNGLNARENYKLKTPDPVTGDLLMGPPMGEFKGQALCVNGKVWPYVELERRPYRFRILNGSNTRMYVLRISGPDAADPSIPDTTQAAAVVPMLQIGSDGGLFGAAVALGGTKKTMPSDALHPEDILMLASGERADIVIDFSSLPEGNYYLSNHATDGDSSDMDHYGTGGDKVQPGLTDALLQIRLLPAVSADPAFKTRLDGVLARLTAAAPANGPQPTPAAGPNPPTNPALATVFRSYFLQEGIGLAGDAVAFTEPAETNTLVDWNPITYEQQTAPASLRHSWAGEPPSVGSPPIGRPVADPIDQDPATRHQLGARIEQWEFRNDTADVHPIHLHHSMFYVLSRSLMADGAARPVDPNENSGWKDTVRLNPGEITTLLVRFDDQGDAANDYRGHYVFHCHLLEHEDMGMMRPLEIY